MKFGIICKGKNNTNGNFGSFWRYKYSCAVKLLNDAYETETDIKVKEEIEKRLKIIDPKQVAMAKCGYCKKKSFSYTGSVRIKPVSAKNV
ncbi:MAG: hypothetical protein LBC12_03805 [Nitrososphaerota archaeon]|jgi:hypothetical protein|nr:hypothetical protein [Nitrososphaerota archaeon]